jgi:hypothetical protein
LRDETRVLHARMARCCTIAKPLRGGLDRLQVFQGATILGDGRVVLIIDPSRLDVGRAPAIETRAVSMPSLAQR